MNSRVGSGSALVCSSELLHGTNWTNDWLPIIKRSPDFFRIHAARLLQRTFENPPAARQYYRRICPLPIFRYVSGLEFAALWGCSRLEFCRVCETNHPL